ncbi:MAG: LysR family transcriptional regulator [Deltaproteobacteria bacterium]|nr:LysR family transcriptional regulator [Deltaproteobacteria bacterium]
MDWNDVRHFLALARTGSVRAAGASLGVSHSTVARRVEALEAQLSTRLFDRSRDGYSLTDAGSQMLPGAEVIEREMATLERGLVGTDERLAGTVAVTCCDSFVSDLVIGDLVGFCAEHPEIEIAYTNDSRSFDLSKREADIAIRTLGIGSQPADHLIGMKLVPIHIANYVATAHAERLDPERDGTEARWISFTDRNFFSGMVAGSGYPDVPPWGGFSSLELMVQAVRRGLGICMLPTYVGDGVPELQRLPRGGLRHMADLWMVSHPDLRDNARLRATRAAVSTALRRQAPLFRGELGRG